MCIVECEYEGQRSISQSQCSSRCVADAVAHVCIAIWHEEESPATLYLNTGNQALWLRYAEWLLSCPVILIHLSNLTGAFTVEDIV